MQQERNYCVGYRTARIRPKIFEKLGIYAADRLDAWYALFKTGDLAYYAALAR